MAGTLRTSPGSYDGFFSLYDYTSNTVSWTANMINRSGSNFGFTCNQLETNGAELCLGGYMFSTGTTQDIMESNTAYFCRYDESGGTARKEWFKEVDSSDSTSVQIFFGFAYTDSALYAVFYHQAVRFAEVSTLSFLKINSADGNLDEIVT